MPSKVQRDTEAEPLGGKMASTLAIAKRLEERAKARPEVTISVPLPPVPASQLPFWSDEYRGLPNALARGALFTAAKDGSRKFLRSAPIVTLSNFHLIYQGEELRQDDASVFMTTLHLARVLQLGERVEFTAFQFLKELGWTRNSEEYRHLQECFERLSATNLKVQVADGRAGYAGSLIRSFEWRNEQGEKLGRWRVLLEPKIVALFGSDTYTLIEWDERKRIGHRAPLALWLHSFLCTHDRPFAMSVTKYKDLCGSKEKNLFGFRSRLTKALTKLVNVGFLKSFEVRADVVHVQKSERRPGLPNRMVSLT